MSGLRSIDPKAAQRLLERGAALLVDIREPDEHARAHVQGARLLPLSRLASAPPLESGGKLVIFHCRSGSRTQANAPRLAALVTGEGAILEGGLEAWKKADLPTRIDTKRPIEIMRQVQIAAGTLVLLGVVLGTLISPWFLLLAGFVGAGLTFAGATGWCGMALLLSQAPWNRQAAAAMQTPAMA